MGLERSEPCRERTAGGKGYLINGSEGHTAGGCMRREARRRQGEGSHGGGGECRGK